MKCPRCHDALLTLEHEGLELDYCDQCHGIWLDRTELHGFAAQSGPQSRLRELVTLHGRVRWLRAPRCPICHRSMREVRLPVARHGELQLDRCPRGCGIWFDRGELPALLEHAPLAAQPQLTQTLRTVFGRLPGPLPTGDTAP